MDLGINLSGAEYGLLSTTQSIDYFAARGFSTIRLPIQWEQLQPVLNGALDANYLKELHEFVAYAETQHMKLILDIHNNGSYNGHLIGSEETPITAFADLWSKLAREFSEDTSISFGLMNEPQSPNATSWLPAVNSAIEAIRDVGATKQQILVSGAYWDGGSTWTQTDNASVIGAPGAIKDPSNNYAFEVHQYLDDTSGTHDWVISDSIGVERLRDITSWAKQEGVKLYLGEFGVASNSLSLSAMSNMLDFLSANSDVWEGASYWAGGVGWQNYMFSVEPNIGILDMPQMAVLQNFTDANIVTEKLRDGTSQVDSYVGTNNTIRIKDVIDNNGEIISRTIYNANGHATRSVSRDSIGNYELQNYNPVTSSLTNIEVYSDSYKLLSRTTFGDDNSKLISFFSDNPYTAVKTESYSSAGMLTSLTETEPGGSHKISIYSGDKIAKLEIYDNDWIIMSRASYDASGHLTSFYHVNSIHQNVVDNYSAGSSHIESTSIFDDKWNLISVRNYPNLPNTLTSENANFASKGYLAANPDVAKSGMDALTHYHQFGWKEGRDPAADFDNELYLLHNPDVKAAGVDPYQHYLQYGQYEGRPSYAAIGNAASFTHGSFDAEYYLLANPDVATAALAAGGDTFAFAYQHYQTYGWHENRSPDAYFDPAYYLAQNPDVAAAHVDPLAHYDQFGWKEGRNPSASFNTSAYLTANPDVAAAHIDPLKHFLQFGADEGRHLA